MQPSRPCHFPTIQWAAEKPTVNLIRIFPGDKAHPARCANRTIAISAAEIGSLCRKLVQMWRLNKRVPPIARHHRVMLIAANDDNIGLAHPIDLLISFML
jgi:hypothetical protein